MSDRDELRKLEKEATPGPWWNESAVIHAPIPGRTDGAACHPASCVNSDREWEDAELIAAMRNALPSLLEDLDRLEKVAEAAREVVEVRYAIAPLPTDGDYGLDEAIIALQTELPALKEDTDE